MTDEPDVLLDCRGMRCPLPVIELGRRIGEVPVGGVVAVVADDPAAAADIPAWCRMRSHDYLGTHTGAHQGEADAGDAPVYRVRRLH